MQTDNIDWGSINMLSDTPVPVSLQNTASNVPEVIRTEDSNKHEGGSIMPLVIGLVFSGVVLAITYNYFNNRKYKLEHERATQITI